MTNCGCKQSCRLHMERNSDGPFPECAPAERYFHVVRDCYVKSADGDCEWDGDFLEGRHATLRDALRVVAAGHPISRYVIQDVPRMGMFPAWTGHSDKAIAELSALEVVTENAELATVK